MDIVEQCSAVLGIATTFFFFGSYVGRKRAARRIAEQEAELDRIRKAFTDEDGDVWTKVEVQDLAKRAEQVRKSIPVVMVANLKGGVGKTSSVANLGAVLDRDHGKRVLMLDLDYQGSLSSICLNAVGLSHKGDSLANKLLTPDEHAHWISEAAIPLNTLLPKSALIPAFYSFADVEESTRNRWLAGESKADLRYSLARYLQSPKTQAAFDIVLIDCPPRLTTGFVVALCSSTHLLVPTILDLGSSEAVPTFLRAICRMRDQLFPALQLAGVVPVMVEQKGSFKDFETSSLKRIRSEARWIAKNGGDVPVFDDAVILRKTSIARAAGSKFASLEDDGIREMYNAVAQKLLSLT